MSLARALIDLVGVLLEVLMLIYLLKAFYGQPILKTGQTVLVYLVVGSAFFLMSITLSEALQRSLGYMLVVMIPTLCYRGKRWPKIITVILFQVVQILVENLVHSGLMLLNQDIFSTELVNVSEYGLGVSLAKFISLILVKVIVIFWSNGKDEQRNIPLKWFGLLLLLPIVTVIMLYLVFILVEDLEEMAFIRIYFASLFLLLLANLAQFHLVDYLIQSQGLKAMMLLAQEQLSGQGRYYQAMAEKNAKLATWAHDMKNYIIALSGYLSQGAYDRAVEHLDKMGISLSRLATVNTGHPMLDAVLTAKLEQGEQQETFITWDMVLGNDILADPMDLVALMANGLDNALEATAKIPEPEKRLIWFQFTKEKKHLILDIRNTVAMDVVIKDNTLVTTKKDKTIHGLGLTNIHRIARQYDGEATLDYKEGIFQLIVVLKNEALPT